MKRKVLSLIIAIAMTASLAAIPTLAAAPTFKIEGKIVLPGNDVAPDGNLAITLEYRSDRGTPDPKDDYTSSALIVLLKGSREAAFSLNIPFSANDKARFTLGYSISSASPYWDKGYYTLNGMQYYKEGQTSFPEGSVSGLVITPIKASIISGSVSLPANTPAQPAFEVTISAKTTGSLKGPEDDFEAKTKLTLTQGAISYSLKVPRTAATAGYTVRYETQHAQFEKQGWYGNNGTVTKASDAAKVDVSSGNRANINLQLVKKANPAKPVNTVPVSFNLDVNSDGKVNIKDFILIFKPLETQLKNKAFMDINGDGTVDVKDYKEIKEELKELRKTLKEIDKVIKVYEKGSAPQPPKPKVHPKKPGK
jgi:hypothetical protein